MASILIVDDNDDIRELLCEMLRGEGYDVWEAEHGARALEVLDEHRVQPGLVLLDLMMPVMGGAEFIEVVKKTRALGGPPIVVYSASGDQSVAQGATRFLDKPAPRESLLRIVREYCGAASKREERRATRTR